MGLRVLGVGLLRPDLGRRGTHDGLELADLRHPDAVVEAAQDLGGDEPLLVVCESGHASRARKVLSLVQVALPRTRLVLRPVQGRALAVAVIGAAVDRFGETADEGAQLSALARLPTACWSAAWVPSVTGSSQPEPSVRQHLRSFLPRSGFLLETGPRARVLTATSAPLRLDVPESPSGPRVLLHTGAGPATPAWLLEAVRTGCGAVRSAEVPTWREPRDAYGSESAVELLLVPERVGALLVREPADVVGCDGCGRRHLDSACPFCGMSITPLVLRERAPIDAPEEVAPGADALAAADPYPAEAGAPAAVAAREVA